MPVDYPTLDEAQEKRIAAVHGGFLYQHLFAVGCLLKANGSDVLKVVIERDEDVEIVLADARIYVQVKTRSDPLVPSDLGTAFERFQQLREQHAQGVRHGRPLFVVASNQPPGQKLSASIERKELEDDIQFIHPHKAMPAELVCLPDCWTDLSGAVADCVRLAEAVPHGSLVPESLVWKLEGKVQAAATGRQDLGGYTFHAQALPALFEQLLTQLQRLPALQAHYLPQIDEPELFNGERIRIVCGFSGAGKTSWCAQAATHSPEPCIYFDARETAGPAFARSLVREIAGGLVENPHEIGEIFAPSASGIDSMTALDRHLEARGIHPLVVIDNAHEMPATDLQAVFSCTPHMRFILLCQPTGSIQELEQLSGVRREVLKGWSLDSVAAEASRLRAWGDVATMERVRTITAGMPLYLQSASRLAAQDYAGDLSLLCTALEQQATLEATAQELILTKVYEGLTQASQQIVTLLSMVDVAITQSELQNLMACYAKAPSAAVNTAIRALRVLGVLEVQGNREIKLHDAMRLVGAGELYAVEKERLLATKTVLKDMLLASLQQARNHHRLRLLIRIFLDLEERELLIDLAGEEMFKETGLGAMLIDFLNAASTAADLDPETRYWAVDSVFFLLHQSANAQNKPEQLALMAQLVNNNALSERAVISYHIKNMDWLGMQGDALGVYEAIDLVNGMPGLTPERILPFHYNAGVALWRANEYEPAKNLIDKTIEECLSVLNIDENWILGRATLNVSAFLHDSSANQEVVNHLASAYEVKSILLKRSGENPIRYRLFAFKFFVCLQAFGSVVRTGLDAAQDMLDMRDFQAARTMVGGNVIPLIQQTEMLGELTSARSFYAVILAYCRDFDTAHREMTSLAPFLAGFSPEKRKEYDFQLQLISDIQAGRVS
ncbi:ATP-binding protein [Pseudomonas canadensis]|uniref:ATP-binding protein n=1 Tax=Pseudomonas canadensis TaxID=915099 RepID=UPI0028935AE7|nr:ATP-binding protein [Pseudomonas canadensis]WNJ86965.1 ATP-binding protein [Pseudomonas canadensis]